MTAQSANVLVLDDEANIRNALAKLLSKAGHSVKTAATVAEAIHLLRSVSFGVVLTDLRMPGQDGLLLLREVKAMDPAIEVIVITAYGSIGTAVEAMREGAYDYIEKPVNMERLLPLLARALERRALSVDNVRLRKIVSVREEYGNLVGRGEKITKLYNLIEMIAPTTATVLIEGESGVGKELIARALHLRSPRATAPMIALNCGAIPENLLESELFGFERGAFTGADKACPGKIELASGGTFFLDEVGEMNPQTQIKLLRVLENREVCRLGSSRTTAVDIRVIAATNKRLSGEVAAGRFREDLFYRLSVVPIRVPPLRERLEDIPILINLFLEEFASLYNRPAKRLTRDATERLLQNRWPGNVRELRNLIERLVVTVHGLVIQLEDLPDEYCPPLSTKPTISVQLGDTLESVEETVIRRTLTELTSHREKAAAILGISPRALHYKLRRFGLAAAEGQES